MAGRVRTVKLYVTDVEEHVALSDVVGEKEYSDYVRSFCKTFVISLDEARIADKARAFAVVAEKLAKKAKK
jgi:protein-disulfide isomerase